LSPAEPLKPPNRETDHAAGYPGQGRHPRDGLFEVRRALGRRARRPDGRGLSGGHARRRHRSQTQLDAAWFSTHIDEIGSGKGGTPLSIALRLPNIAVTRVENFCASGSEAFRGAVYAVAAGAADIALAVGVEKLKDTGYGGLPVGNPGTLNPQVMPNGSAPGNFAQLASAYRAKHGVSKDDLKRAIAHVSVKSHANGAKNPKAHLRKPITAEQALAAPMIAEPLGLFDCCGVSDGAAAAIVTTPEIARSLGKHDLVTVKALQLSVSNGYESQYNGWDGSHFHTARIAAGKAYREAGIERPREQISMMEVHDCFSITELVTMEDLFISPEGQGWRDVLDGFYDAGGGVPCQIDGGLKCFGHPIGASGLRMLYEMYLQLQGRAGERQLANPVFGMTHNLGGAPASNVCSVAIIGQEGA
jgi:acetyl-CoA C-acetyltransferase